MPPKSRAQAKAMFAAKEGKSTLGIPQNVGADFVNSLIGHPGAMNGLPQQAPQAPVVHVHIHNHAAPPPPKKKRAAPKPNRGMMP